MPPATADLAPLGAQDLAGARRGQNKELKRARDNAAVGLEPRHEPHWSRFHAARRFSSPNSPAPKSEPL
jgi:hypothetical protein